MTGGQRFGPRPGPRPGSLPAPRMGSRPGFRGERESGRERRGQKAGLLAIPASTERLVAAFDTGADSGQQPGKHHPGLLLDRWFRFGGDLTSPGFTQELQHAHLQRVVNPTHRWPEELRQARAAREAVLSVVAAHTWRRRTLWRLTLHLSRSNVLENAGLCLHPIYGFAYIPGSGLKGLARNYAETEWLPLQQDSARSCDLIRQVFGWAPSAEPEEGAARAPKGGGDGQARGEEGAVIFHDAWPTAWPALQIDIVNSHHSEYYTKDKEERSFTPLEMAWRYPAGPNSDLDPQRRVPSEPPADYQAPKPVYFLTVAPGTEFEFAISRRRGDVPDQLVSLAQGWLDKALEDFGVGAKTSSGYGYFAPPEAAKEELSATRTPSAQMPPDPRPKIKPRDRVNAVLLAEKTKKGGWKARLEGYDLSGAIMGEPPPGVQPGKRVELEVASISHDGRQIQFRWLSR